MTPSPRRHQGFTLIEIMVVVTIIGILSGMIVMNIVTGDPQKDLNHEAKRLKAVLEMAQDEALFGRQDIGVVVTENSYSFAKYALVEQEPDPNQPQPVNPSLTNIKKEPEWVAISDENEFRLYELSEDYEIVLEVDDQLIDPTGGKKDPSGNNTPSKFANDDKIRPSIYISPANEMSPFVMEIYLKEDSDIMVKLSGDETGRLWIGDDEAF